MTATIDLGNLRTYLAIERRDVTRDAAGEQAITWTSVGNVWARVEALTGHELMAAQAVRATDTHRITIRYWPGLTAKDRFNYLNPEGLTVYFGISDVIDLDKEHRFMQCTAVEGLGGT